MDNYVAIDVSTFLGRSVGERLNHLKADRNLLRMGSFSLSCYSELLRSIFYEYVQVEDFHKKVSATVFINQGSHSDLFAWDASDFLARGVCLQANVIARFQAFDLEEPVRRIVTLPLSFGSWFGNAAFGPANLFLLNRSKDRSSTLFAWRSRPVQRRRRFGGKKESASSSNSEYRLANEVMSGTPFFLKKEEGKHFSIRGLQLAAYEADQVLEDVKNYLTALGIVGEEEVLIPTWAKFYVETPASTYGFLVRSHFEMKKTHHVPVRGSHETLVKLKHRLNSGVLNQDRSQLVSADFGVEESQLPNTEIMTLVFKDPLPNSAARSMIRRVLKAKHEHKEKGTNDVVVFEESLEVEVPIDEDKGVEDGAGNNSNFDLTRRLINRQAKGGTFSIRPFFRGTSDSRSFEPVEVTTSGVAEKTNNFMVDMSKPDVDNETFDLDKSAVGRFGITSIPDDKNAAKFLRPAASLRMSDPISRSICWFERLANELEARNMAFRFWFKDGGKLLVRSAERNPKPAHFPSLDATIANGMCQVSFEAAKTRVLFSSHAWPVRECLLISYGFNIEHVEQVVEEMQNKTGASALPKQCSIITSTDSNLNKTFTFEVGDVPSILPFLFEREENANDGVWLLENGINDGENFGVPTRCGVQSTFAVHAHIVDLIERQLLPNDLSVLVLGSNTVWIRFTPTNPVSGWARCLRWTGTRSLDSFEELLLEKMFQNRGSTWSQVQVPVASYEQSVCLFSRLDPLHDLAPVPRACLTSMRGSLQNIGRRVDSNLTGRGACYWQLHGSNRTVYVEEKLGSKTVRNSTLSRLTVFAGILPEDHVLYNPVASDMDHGTVSMVQSDKGVVLTQQVPEVGEFFRQGETVVTFLDVQLSSKIKSRSMVAKRDAYLISVRSLGDEIELKLWFAMKHASGDKMVFQGGGKCTERRMHLNHPESEVFVEIEKTEDGVVVCPPSVIMDTTTMFKRNNVNILIDAVAGAATCASDSDPDLFTSAVGWDQCEEAPWLQSKEGMLDICSHSPSVYNCFLEPCPSVQAGISSASPNYKLPIVGGEVQTVEHKENGRACWQTQQTAEPFFSRSLQDSMKNKLDTQTSLINAQVSCTMERDDYDWVPRRRHMTSANADQAEPMAEDASTV